MKENADFFQRFLLKKCNPRVRASQCIRRNCFSIEQGAIEPSYIFDPQTRKIIEANDEFFALLQYSAEDLPDLYLDQILVAQQQEIENVIIRYLHKDVAPTLLRQYRRKDGEVLMVRSGIQVGMVNKNQYVFVAMRDVTEWQHLQERLRLSYQIFDSASDGIIVTDIKGTIQFANPAFLQTTGYPLEEVLGKTTRILHSGKQDDHFYKNMWYLLRETGQWQGEIWNKRKNGEVYPEWLVINAMKNDIGQVSLYSGIFRNLSERLKYEDQIKYQAYHDGLTGLPNRRAFYEKIHECILMAKRYQHLVAIMFIDLDGFKSVNDNFGHDVGDILLKETGKRLLDCVRETDIVARMGGDEFTLILPAIAIKLDASRVAEQIKQVLNEAFEINGHTITISSSIGISIFPDDGDDEELLVKKADDAMYKAKQAGKNTYKSYGE